MSGLNDFVLMTKSLVYAALASTRDLPGRRFDYYGRRLGWRQKRCGKPARQLLVNPVSSVRYFEFDFVERHLPSGPQLRILDVSSPALFGYYISENRYCDYVYTNLDEREFAHIQDQVAQVKVKGSYCTESQDARVLSFPDSSFDVVVSISVVEHIPGAGDIQAISEMWRVLRPGGLLLITIPISTSYEEEFRAQDTYRIGLEKDDEGFFFQRLYSESEVAKRLVKILQMQSEFMLEIYGEKAPGFFRQYEKQWMARGLEETVKDAYLMAFNMKKYGRFSNLVGFGVAGLCLKKCSVSVG